MNRNMYIITTKVGEVGIRYKLMQGERVILRGRVMNNVQYQSYNLKRLIKARIAKQIIKKYRYDMTDSLEKVLVIKSADGMLAVA